MLTLVDLKKLEFQAAGTILECSKDIASLIKVRAEDAIALKLQEKELKRLKNRHKAAKESIALYKFIHAYLSSGVQMDGIKQQRNELMVKLATIREREKDEGINRELTDKENKKVIAAFETKYKVKKLKTQLRTLNFILR
jgi:hypothetical protein